MLLPNTKKADENIAGLQAAAVLAAVAGPYMHCWLGGDAFSLSLSQVQLGSETLVVRSRTTTDPQLGVAGASSQLRQAPTAAGWPHGRAHALDALTTGQPAVVAVHAVVSSADTILCRSRGDTRAPSLFSSCFGDGVLRRAPNVWSTLSGTCPWGTASLRGGERGGGKISDTLGCSLGSAAVAAA